MKKIVSLAMAFAITMGASIGICAKSSPLSANTNGIVTLNRIAPRMSYEDQVRKISSKGSWTSSKYYCMVGEYFGGGIDDPDVSMTGKIQYSTTTSGPWTTLSTKTLKGTGMSVEVTKKGYYRFVLSNPNSYSVEVGCFVIVDSE